MSPIHDIEISKLKDKQEQNVVNQQQLNNKLEYQKKFKEIMNYLKNYHVKIIILLNLIWLITLQIQFETKNQKLEENINSLQNKFDNYIQNTTQIIDSLQNNLNDSIQKITYLNTENNNLKENSKTLSSTLKSFIDNQPKTTLYGPFLGEEDAIYYTIRDKVTVISKTAKITLKQKSLVTFVVNGSFNSQGDFYNSITFLKDKVPIAPISNLKDFTFYSLYAFTQGWSQLNLVQEAVIEAGTYNFEVGVNSPKLRSDISVFALGFTIKVQELQS